MQEVKKVNQQREKELEDRIYQFNKQKDEVFDKAKNEALKEEKRKRQGF